MKMDHKARMLTLWISVLGLVVAAIQISPGGIFLPVPAYMTIILAAFLVSLGIYGYQRDRLTPWKTVTVALFILAIFGWPNILKPFVGWTW